MLVFVPLFLLVMLAINLWSSLHLPNMSRWEAILFPAVIICLIALGVAGLYHWFRFAVEVSDQGINISGAQLRWEDLKSAHARLSTHFTSFSTLIELKCRNGQIYKIPACIQQGLFILREIQKHLPEGNRE
jgi:hypothetical protein